MPSVDISVRHAFTPKALLGGSSSVTFGKGFLQRAKTSEKPKVSSPHKYKGDHVLTRGGRKGALVLGRLHKAFQSKLPKPQGSSSGPSTTGNGQTVQSKATTGVTTPPPTTQTTGVAPQTFAEKLTALQDRASQLKDKVDDLHQKMPGEQSTRKDRVKIQAKTLGERRQMKADAEKALGEVGKELAKKIGEHLAAIKSGKAATDPEVSKLSTEISQLKEVRRSFIEVGLVAEFPNATNAGDALLHKGGVVTSLWGLLGTLQGTHRDELKALIGIKNSPGAPEGFGTLEIGRMIDDFNAGRPIVKDDGTVVTALEFREIIDDLIYKLSDFSGTMFHGAKVSDKLSTAKSISSDGGDDQFVGTKIPVAVSDAARKAIDELKHLHAQLDCRIEYADAVTELENAIDKWSSVYLEPNPPPNPNPFPSGFPLSGALLAIGSALQGPDGVGVIGTGTKALISKAETCEGIRVACKTLARGELSIAFQGYDVGFDRASLLYKQGRRGRHGRSETQGRPGKSGQTAADRCRLCSACQDR